MNGHSMSLLDFSIYLEFFSPRKKIDAFFV